MKKNKISIITVTKNSEKYLEKNIYMKIAICVCFSEKNISHHKKILRDINQIIIPKGYHLKFCL